MLGLTLLSPSQVKKEAEKLFIARLELGWKLFARFCEWRAELYVVVSIVLMCVLKRPDLLTPLVTAAIALLTLVPVDT